MNHFLPLGQIRPTGWLAAQMRQTWSSGLPEGSDAWIRHALLVGEGKGTLQVRAWARRTGAGDNLSALAPVREGEAGTGLDAFVCGMVQSDGRSLAVFDYGPVVVKAAVQGVPLTLEMASDEPEALGVDLHFYPEEPVTFSLTFRLPAWAEGCMVTGDGASGGELTDQEGWVELTRTWNRGDSLHLQFERQTESP